MCGEQQSSILRPVFVQGSPPRVRGTVERIFVLHANLGITPACAGNSLLGLDLGKQAEDHPRVCGEQFSYGAANTRRQGSPPRVRGTASKTTFANSQARITPACAGNSMGLDNTPSLRRDHPRVCGEQLSFR